MLLSLAEQIIGAVQQLGVAYYRLLLLVGPPGSGKTSVLHQAAEAGGIACLNLSLELSQALLELTERQRALRVTRLLDNLLAKTSGDVVLLDNIEIIFSPALRLDPLRCLQQLSRTRTIVAAWPGSIDGRYLVYGQPEHLEYRRYPADDLQIVTSAKSA